MEKFLIQEWGIVGVIIFLFIGMIHFLKTQLLGKLKDTDSKVIALIDRWNRSDEVRERRHEQVLEQINRITDDQNFIKGKVVGVIDSLKTIGNGVLGVGVWWINLPMILQMFVSIATLVYIIIKINKELKDN